MVKGELEFKNKDRSDFNYDFASRCYSLLNKINTDKRITAKNKTIIKEFIGSLQREGLSLATIRKYLAQLSVIGTLLKKDLDKCKKEDVEDLVEEITKHYISSDESVSMHIITTRKLFAWYKEDDFDDTIKWIKIKNYTKRAKKKDNASTYENIITPEEVELMISKADNPRDKALVGCLFYGAMRLGGLVDLKIKDVLFEESITWLNLFEGKSGYRKVPVTEVTKLLQNWLECHIDKNNPEAYLWLQERNVSKLGKHYTGDNKIEYEQTHISNRRIADIVKELAIKSGIRKRVNCHNWRHSRITHLKLIGLDDDYIKIYAGHSKFSNITNLYKHLGVNELKGAMEKLYGVVKDDTKKDLMKKCYRCNFMNRSTLKICENCGLALDNVSALNIGKNEKKSIGMNRAVGMLLKTPAFQKALARQLLDAGMLDYVKELAEEEK